MSHPVYGLNELREMFLRFFESKGHLRLPSFSLIPQNDKSILLINAGMAPMKPWFKGEEEPPRRRVCTCQKCIRTGDIDNVGHTARHGTFFEMLGNFSFGDYFKHEAIAWSWEFLTSPEWVGLEPDRLYPSVFVGSETTPRTTRPSPSGVTRSASPPSASSASARRITSGSTAPVRAVPAPKFTTTAARSTAAASPAARSAATATAMLRCGTTSFPSSTTTATATTPSSSRRTSTPAWVWSVWRVVSQDVDSLFDVDTVMHITNKVSEITGAHYGESNDDATSPCASSPTTSDPPSFMICDGVLPSNEGRGYVLRRLLRRAARHGKLLGVNRPVPL